MNKQEIDSILNACDELDIDPPWDHTVDLRSVSLQEAIEDLMSGLHVALVARAEKLFGEKVHEHNERVFLEKYIREREDNEEEKYD